MACLCVAVFIIVAVGGGMLCLVSWFIEILQGAGKAYPVWVAIVLAAIYVGCLIVAFTRG